MVAFPHRDGTEPGPSRVELPLACTRLAGVKLKVHEKVNVGRP